MFSEKTDLYIYEVSHKRVEYPDKSNYINHVHEYCEVLLFISGSADYSIDGSIYSPKPYDLLLIPKTKYHCLIPKGGQPYENYVIGFDPSLVSEEHIKRIFDDRHIVNIAHDDEMIGCFKRLDRYYSICTHGDFLECAQMLTKEILIYLSYIPKNSEEHEYIRSEPTLSIIRLIDSSLTEHIDAGIIAKKLFLSKSYVQNSFSSVMHIGLKQYINQRKVFAAKEDMDKGMSAGDACRKYAFDDYSVFYRAYKKVFGTSPANGGRKHPKLGVPQ